MSIHLDAPVCMNSIWYQQTHEAEIPPQQEKKMAFY